MVIDPVLLADVAPFDALTPQERTAVAAASGVRELAAGDAVLVEDGEPADALYLVLEGAFELVHQDVVIDVLGPGESFGHPSLLSRSAPAFTVRARERSRCLLVPRPVAVDVLSRPAGVAWVARSLRHRLVETGHAAHGLPELSTTRVGALVGRAPLVLEPGTTVQQAAQEMTAGHARAALVEVEGELAILTDADLREEVLAAGRGPDTPVGAVARRDVLRVRADRTAGEALVELLDQERRELCVVDAAGRVVGLLSAEEIAGGAHSTFGLRLAIARAPDEAALTALVRERLPRLLHALLAAGLAHADICRVLTLQSDAATARLLDFALARHGPAPAPWAWLALGSVARRELTLASDQDNALAFGDDGGPDADACFARITADVNAGLSACGLGEDASEVLARSPDWRMPAAAWERTFRECLVFPDRSRLVRASVAFDFRAVAGPLEIVPPLVAVLREARAHPGFIARLARTVTDLRLPVRRGGRLATDRDGRIDLKTGGALPVANLARVHALAHGITISGTVERLLAAEEAGHLDRETATGLREAFDVVSRIRLEHHAGQIAEGRAPDNRIDPGALPPLRRAALREALRAVSAAQRQLMVFARPGL